MLKDRKSEEEEFYSTRIFGFLGNFTRQLNFVRSKMKLEHHLHPYNIVWLIFVYGEKKKVKVKGLKRKIDVSPSVTKDETWY